MDIKLQKNKKEMVWSTLELRAKMCQIKTPPLPVFTPHADTQIINNIKKAAELSPPLEIWAPLQSHLIPFKPNECNGDRDPPSHHLHSWDYRKRGGHCWLRPVPTAGNNSSTFKMCHQGEQPSAGRGLMLCLAQCGFFLMFSSLHFKLCSSKKKMRKT